MSEGEAPSKAEETPQAEASESAASESAASESAASESTASASTASASAAAAPEQGEDHDAPLMEHEYDGIQEYDNPLPGWWSFLFWVPILLSPFYVVVIHGNQGNDVQGEYTAAANEIAARKTAEALRNPLSEEGLVSMAADPATLAAAAGIFASKCVVCHGPQGQGKIGPNLTDAYWINGGSPLQIHETIAKGGRKGEGMKAWESELGMIELRQVTAYVLSLKGTTPPNPKAPQGTLEQ